MGARPLQRERMGSVWGSATHHHQHLASKWSILTVHLIVSWTLLDPFFGQHTTTYKKKQLNLITGHLSRAETRVNPPPSIHHQYSRLSPSQNNGEGGVKAQAFLIELGKHASRPAKRMCTMRNQRITLLWCNKINSWSKRPVSVIIGATIKTRGDWHWTLVAGSAEMLKEKRMMSFTANCKLDWSPFHLTRCQRCLLPCMHRGQGSSSTATASVWLTELYGADNDKTCALLLWVRCVALHWPPTSREPLFHGPQLHHRRPWPYNVEPLIDEHAAAEAVQEAEEVTWDKPTRMYANKFPIKLIIKSMSDRLTCDLINFP